MKLIYWKSSLKCDPFDVTIGIEIPFFRVLVTIEPGRSLLQFVTANCLKGIEYHIWSCIAISSLVFQFGCYLGPLLSEVINAWLLLILMLLFTFIRKNLFFSILYHREKQHDFSKLINIPRQEGSLSLSLSN